MAHNDWTKECFDCPSPLLICSTSSKIAFFLNLDVGDMGHTFVFGPAGAGKSTFLCLMESQFLKYRNAGVIILDKDKSARSITMASGGVYTEPRRGEDWRQLYNTGRIGGKKGRRRYGRTDITSQAGIFGRGVSAIHPQALSTENQLPWMLDIVFREDECRVRTGKATLNMNILRKMALHRLRKMKMEKKRVSTKQCMMHAVLDSEFLYEALFSA
jgi:energy-coupling factor transporter ATP-binding protein EcfA2